MKRIKVAMLGEYSSNVYTGSLAYINKLAEYVSCSGDIELHMITLGKGSQCFKKDNLSIYEIEKNGAVYNPFKISALLCNMKRRVMEINPDIVHCVSTGLRYSNIAAFVRDRYPTVLTIYGIALKERRYIKKEYKKFSHFIFSPIPMINERYVISRIPNIVVDSLSIKNLVSKWTKSRIYVIPAGIEYDKIKKIQSSTLLNKNPDIFIVTNLEKIKGVDILIKAIPIIVNSIPNLLVYIAGFGLQENELKSLAKRSNLEDYIKFLGFVSDEEKYRYYKACKLVVVPSRWDCQPFALFDAAASGKPVIASDMSNPGIVDDGKTGLIFESRNVEDLADKVVILLKDEKLREEMGKVAEEKVKQYDWSKVAERYVEIYNEVIADFHERKAKNKKGGEHHELEQKIGLGNRCRRIRRQSSN